MSSFLKCFTQSKSFVTGPGLAVVMLSPLFNIPAVNSEDYEGLLVANWAQNKHTNKTAS